MDGINDCAANAGFKYARQGWRTRVAKRGIIGIMNSIVYRWNTRERVIHPGVENRGVSFYVIRGVDSNSKFYRGVDLNLLANYSYVISHLMYAEKKGLTPIVDQLHYPVYNRETFPINGTMNPWEYFWKQPSCYSLDEVYRSRTVILSKRNWYARGNPAYSIQYHRDPKVIAKFHRLMEKVPLNEPTQSYVNKKATTLFPEGAKVLGVSMRNAGYSTSSVWQAPGHPIQPDIEELINIVKERQKIWKADFVFLATEEADNIEKFQSVFQDTLLYNDRLRYNGWHIFSKDDPNPLYQSGRRYQTALDYLTEMEMLARCSSLIGSLTSGLRYAIFRNNCKYKHLEIIDKGRFPEKT